MLKYYIVSFQLNHSINDTKKKTKCYFHSTNRTHQKHSAIIYYSLQSESWKWCMRTTHTFVRFKLLIHLFTDVHLNKTDHTKDSILYVDYTYNRMLYYLQMRGTMLVWLNIFYTVENLGLFPFFHVENWSKKYYAEKNDSITQQVT